MARLSYVPGEYDLVVKRARKGAGLGLFVGEKEIPKGACVIEYIGVPLTKEEENASNSKYLFEITAKKTIDGAPRWNTARYINHSCKPNCEPNIYKGRIYIHARRRIKPGEELNYDYGINYFKQFLKGHCMCPKCAPTPAAKKAAPSLSKVAKKKKTVAKKQKTARKAA